MWTEGAGQEALGREGVTMWEAGGPEKRMESHAGYEEDMRHLDRQVGDRLAPERGTKVSKGEVK